jgi:glycosyltransferase involved in cell wall biosynthesis
MNKNILEFCLSDGIGGLELFVGTCYKSFKTQTNCKLMVAKNSKLDSFFDSEEKFYLKRNKLLPIIPAIKLAKFIDNNSIDIIHFHWTRDINTVILAKILSRKKPKIIQSRHMNMTRFKDDFYHRWLYRNIDVIHAVTFQVKKQLETYIPADIRPKIEMIYIGCDAQKVNLKRVQELKKEYNIHDEFIVGTIGRIEKNKGQYLVIEALSMMKDLNIKVLIVGLHMDEKYMAELKTNIRKFDLEDKVIFTGFTKEINEHLQLFDVNILATPNETFGLVIIEAMANRICVIATNNGGPLEIIDDNTNGLLFNRTSESLKEKIEHLYKNRELQDALALKGQQKAEKNFNKNIQLNKLYIKITEEI